MGKTVLITGANRGLGLEFVRQLLATGDTVFAACRDPGQAPALEALRGTGDLHLVPLEVTDDAAIAAAVERVAAVGPLDWLINNAGIGDMAGLAELTREGMRQSFEVNTISPLVLSRAFAPLLARSGGTPLVVVISSLLGSIARKSDGMKGGYPYAASKAAVNMMVKFLSLDLRADGIATVALSPGWVKTDMGGEEAPLEPRESIAAMLEVLGRIDLAQSGEYWDYNGDRLPW